MLRSFLRVSAVLAVPFALTASLLSACSNDDIALGSEDDGGTQADGSSTTSSCQAAGGTCHLGGFSCTTMAPTAAQDCNPEELPSGTFCCLDPVDSGSTADASGQLPACTIPASLDATDADLNGQCTARRALLSCQISGGEIETCLSDDVTQCPAEDGSPDASFLCTDSCAADEYGAECGFGDNPAPAPPAGCRSLGVAPSGTTSYCCPCGT